LHVRWAALADSGLADTLAEAGASTPELLAGILLLGPEEVARLVEKVPPHVDDFPEVEYRSGRVLDREASWLANFRMLWAYRAHADRFSAFPGDWGAVIAHRDAAVRSELRELGRRVASRPR
jgi:hypothetical protein